MVETALSVRVADAGLDWIVPDWPAAAQVCALSTTRNGRAGAAFDAARDQPPFASAREELMRWLPGRADLARPGPWHGNLRRRSGAGARDIRPAGRRRRGRARRRRRLRGALRRLPAGPVDAIAKEASSPLRTPAGADLRRACSKRRLSRCARRRRTFASGWDRPSARAHSKSAPMCSTAHCAADPGAAECFRPLRSGKWLADLYALARRRLLAPGVMTIHGGGRCTLTERETFHSYRRDGAAAGRMATLIWIAANVTGLRPAHARRARRVALRLCAAG